MEQGKRNKMFDVTQARTLRDLVDQANRKGLTKDDIVEILGHDEGFFLLYYK